MKANVENGIFVLHHGQEKVDAYTNLFDIYRYGTGPIMRTIVPKKTQILYGNSRT